LVLLGNFFLFLSLTLSVFLIGCVQTTPSIRLPAPSSQPAELNITKNEPQLNKSDTVKIDPIQLKEKTFSKTEKNKKITEISKPLTHKQFFDLIGKKKITALVGISLQLNLKFGAITGAEGYLDDEQDLILYSCPKSTHIFKGGRLISKVAKIRSNDNGVFVTLDRCDT
jgi:hypothetical protein